MKLVPPNSNDDMLPWYLCCPVSMTAGSFNILASVKHVALQSITHIKKKYEKYAKNFFKDTLKFK